ncbi:1-deoxy-D-xylulose-5-phosphate synthase [Sesbania bispinosa]|nr:1-deoxy-D-xylulose-5-phosphate synthase [Sesbania bispinosa]
MHLDLPVPPETDVVAARWRLLDGRCRCSNGGDATSRTVGDAAARMDGRNLTLRGKSSDALCSLDRSSDSE